MLMAMLMATDLDVAVPTIFLTLSSADLYWPELMHMIDSSLTDEQIRDMPKSNREELLASNPILAAHTKQCSGLIQGHREPLGKVVDYWVRLETQLRGSLH